MAGGMENTEVSGTEGMSIANMCRGAGLLVGIQQSAGWERQTGTGSFSR
jgi:hypothetical protein